MDPSVIPFYQLFEGAPPPRRADKTLFGSIPVRAHSYCEPLTVASGFGWHLFPPLDFALLWDGTTVLWRVVGAPKWKLLDEAVFPGFLGQHKKITRKFRYKAPVVPFLTSIREPGIVQIWTGLLVKTPPDWAVLIRPPANLPKNRGFDVFEGVIESDWWFGPLISNIRLCRTGNPVVFRTRWPLFQVQPIPKTAYSDQLLSSARVVTGLEALSSEEWMAHATAMTLRSRTRPGSYKAEVRRRKNSAGQCAVAEK